MKGKNDPTAFLPLNTKIDRPVKSIVDKENICLAMDQAWYIYKKLEQEGIANVDKIKQEIEENKLSNNNDKGEEEEINPCHNIIISNIERENVITSQMEQ